MRNCSRILAIADTGKLLEKDICYVVGGFPSGDFHSNVYELCDRKVCIYPEMLTVWTVASEILVNYENEIEKNLR